MRLSTLFLRIIFLGFCSLLSFFAHSLHIGAPHNAEKDKVLKFAFVEIDSFPYEYTEHNELIGLHIEVIEQVSKNLGYEIQIYRMPWPRILRMLSTGDIDGASYIGGAKDSHDMTWFNDDSVLSINSFHVMKLKTRKDIKFSGDLNDLKGLKIAMQRGYLFLDGRPKDLPFEIIEVDSPMQLYLMLKAGRVDASLGMRSALDMSDFKHKSLIRVMPRPLMYFYVTVGFSKANFSKAFSDTFAEEMRTFRDSVDYLRIQKKYNKIRLQTKQDKRKEAK
jgi:ABC-type amino acid transport substrate-binding protein